MKSFKKKLRKEAEILYASTGINLAAFAGHPIALARGLPVETSLDLQSRLNRSKPIPPKGPVPSQPLPSVSMPETPQPAEEVREEDGTYINMSSTVQIDPSTTAREGSEDTTTDPVEPGENADNQQESGGATNDPEGASANAAEEGTGSFIDPSLNERLEDLQRRNTLANKYTHGCNSYEDLIAIINANYIRVPCDLSDLRELPLPQRQALLELSGQRDFLGLCRMPGILTPDDYQEVLKEEPEPPLRSRTSTPNKTTAPPLNLMGPHLTRLLNRDTYGVNSTPGAASNINTTFFPQGNLRLNTNPTIHSYNQAANTARSSLSAGTGLEWDYYNANTSEIAFQLPLPLESLKATGATSYSNRELGRVLPTSQYEAGPSRVDVAPLAREDLSSLAAGVQRMNTALESAMAQPNLSHVTRGECEGARNLICTLATANLSQGGAGERSLYEGLARLRNNLLAYDPTTDISAYPVMAGSPSVGNRRQSTASQPYPAARPDGTFPYALPPPPPREGGVAGRPGSQGGNGRVGNITGAPAGPVYGGSGRGGDPPRPVAAVGLWGQNPGYGAPQNPRPPGPPAGGPGGGGPPAGGPGGGGPPGPPAGGGNNPQQPQQGAQGNDAAWVPQLVVTLQTLAQSVMAPQSNQQYRDAIIHLPYFSGQPANDHKNCTPASKGMVEPNVDRFLWLFSHFRISNPTFDESKLRRGLYERLTGAAAEYMRLQRTDMAYSIDALLQRLRIHFISSRTFAEVTRDIGLAKRKEGEMIAHFMGRMDRLYVELVTLNEMSPDLKEQALFQEFKVHCTDPRCRERIANAGYDNPRDLSMAMAIAQDYYNTYELAPWSAHLTRGEVERKNKDKNKKPVNSVTNAPPKPFGGICFKCQKKGHRAADCVLSSSLTNIRPRRESGQGAATPGSERNCVYCLKPGHAEDKCWTLARVLKIVNQRSSGASGPTGARNPIPAPRGQNRGSNNGQRGRGRGRGRRSVNTVGAPEEAVEPLEAYEATNEGSQAGDSSFQEN